MHVTTLRTRLGIAAGSALLLLTAVACSSGTQSSGGGGGGSAAAAPTDGVLTVGLLGDIGQPPDPDIYYANNGTAIMINAYEGLVQYKNNTDQVEIAPRLAESWKVNDTNDVYTFQLRKGVTFHDGTPFTSKAVDVAFKRRIAVKGGAAYMVSGVTKVETPDNYTAVVHLDKPNTAFLSYLASPFGPKMESPTGLEKNGGSDNAQTYLTTHDLGTGPYELTAAQTGVKYELTQYDGYWGTKSPFKKVGSAGLHRFVGTGIGVRQRHRRHDRRRTPVVQPGQIRRKGRRLELLPADSAGRTGDGEPQPRILLQDRRARVAFLKSIDQARIGEAGAGQAIRGGHHHVRQGHDPRAAKRQAGDLLRRGRAKAYVDALPANANKTLVIGYANGNVNAQSMANIVVANLQTVGLNASAQGYDTSTVFGWINDPPSGPDAFIDGNNGPDGGDPYMWGHVFWDASGGINYFGCQSTGGQRPAEPGARHRRHGHLRQGRRPVRTDRVLPEPVLQPGLGGGAEVADRRAGEPEHRRQRVELLLLGIAKWTVGPRRKGCDPTGSADDPGEARCRDRVAAQPIAAVAVPAHLLHGAGADHPRPVPAGQSAAGAAHRGGAERLAGAAAGGGAAAWSATDSCSPTRGEARW